LYKFWVFVHIVGVVGFFSSHGVSMIVTFRLRKERDPQKVSSLIELSGSSIRSFYTWLGLLLLGGIVAGFLGHWWSYAWIWAAIIVLVVTSIAMYAMARPYYRRVGLVARAMAGGSQAVTPQQFDEILSGSRAGSIAGIGFVALIAILYLMVFKPTLGFTTSAGTIPLPAGPIVQVQAKNGAFDTDELTAPAGVKFTIVFQNDDPGVPHNVAIYLDPSASSSLFHGPEILGPKTVNYSIPTLQPGTYFFRCDVHPATMTGTFVVQPIAVPS
jgi:plastocyanin